MPHLRVNESDGRGDRRAIVFMDRSWPKRLPIRMMNWRSSMVIRRCDMHHRTWFVPAMLEPHSVNTYVNCRTRAANLDRTIAYAHSALNSHTFYTMRWATIRRRARRRALPAWLMCRVAAAWSNGTCACQKIYNPQTRRENERWERIAAELSGSWKKPQSIFHVGYCTHIPTWENTMFVYSNKNLLRTFFGCCC